MSKLSIKVHLSAQDIKDAIVTHIWNELEISVCTNDVTIDIEKEFNDRQPGDSGTCKLKGASINVPGKK